PRFSTEYFPHHGPHRFGQRLDWSDPIHYRRRRFSGRQPRPHRPFLRSIHPARCQHCFRRQRFQSDGHRHSPCKTKRPCRDHHFSHRPQRHHRERRFHAHRLEPSAFHHHLERPRRRPQQLVRCWKLVAR